MPVPTTRLQHFLNIYITLKMYTARYPLLLVCALLPRKLYSVASRVLQFLYNVNYRKHVKTRSTVYANVTNEQKPKISYERAETKRLSGKGLNRSCTQSISIAIQLIASEHY